MSGYSEPEKALDEKRLLKAFEHIDQLRTTFGDVIVFPDVVTIEDVCDIALDTTKGPQLVGAVCSREEIVHILRSFQDNPCGDPALVAQYALDDYRQTHNAKKE
jgi:hypothetical protein